MTPTTDRVKLILEDLDSVQENLLALSDDIWLNIDHNDNQALNDGVSFKQDFNGKLGEFRHIAEAIRTLVESYTGVISAEGPLAESTNLLEESLNPAVDTSQRESRQRQIALLDGSTPHYLDEEMTFKRPLGFRLRGNVVSDTRTWRRLLQGVCRQLHKLNPERFQGLSNDRLFISSRGNPSFSGKRSDLRDGMAVPGGLYVEANLSAKNICDLIMRLLPQFGIGVREMQVYLREDRDA